MSKVIDLGTMVKDDLVFKMPNGDVFRIKGQVPLAYVVELSKMENDLNDAEDTLSQIKLLKNIVLKTLQLDENKKVNMKYIDENINDILLMKVIMEEMIKHISNTMNDENL